MATMTMDNPELPKDLRGLIEHASRMVETGETGQALTLVRSAQRMAAGLTQPAMRAQALTEIGYIGFRIGALKDSESAFQQILDSPQGKVTDQVSISATLGLGMVFQASERFSEGALQYLCAIDLAVKLGAENLCELSHRKLGECYLELGDYERASLSLSKALELAEKLMDVENESHLLGCLGLCSIRLNKLDVAQRYHEQRLSLAQNRKDTMAIGVAMGDLGMTHALLGQYRVAHDYFRRARAYFAEQLGAADVLAYADANIVKAAQSIGDELVEYVSRTIAEMPLINSDADPEEIPGDQEYSGDVQQDLLCAILALTDDLSDILPLISHISFHERSRMSSSDILTLVGEITRHTADMRAPDPHNLFEATRFIVQIRRSLRAARLLERIRKGEVGPDISGDGHGGYLLYLRSFVAESMMPIYRTEPWGDIDLEEIIASKLDQGPWPLVAIGNPEIQSFGAGKIQTEDATWKNDLTLLGQHANFVVVAPCATEGTSWEIEWVVINKFLKKTVFVMPPSSTDRQHWWEENWVAVQRWGHYLGLAFPKYTSDGMFFALGPEQQIATKDYKSVLRGSQLWSTLLHEVLGQFLPSSEWLVLARDARPDVMFQSEIEDRGVDPETLSQEKVDEHVARMEGRIRRIDPRLLDKVSPYMLGILEKGLPPQGAFASWPPEPGRIPSSSGVCTIWEGPTRLIWVEATSDLFATLNSYAEGRIGDNRFCESVLNELVLPGLSKELELDMEIGVLPSDKMVRFQIRRSFRYRLLPIEIGKARLYEATIKQGVLDAGAPQLNSER